MQVESVQSTLRLLIDRAGEASPETSLLTAILAGSLVWFVIHRRSRSTTMPKSSNFKDSEFDLPDLVNLECQSVVDVSDLISVFAFLSIVSHSLKRWSVYLSYVQMAHS